MFRVSTGGQTIVMSPRSLVEALVAKSISSKAADKTKTAVPILAEAMAERLESQGLLRDSTPRQLLALGIGVGYYLNTFFRKNEVEIQEQVDATERHSALDRDPPSSEGSSLDSGY
jgi:hypothetical protein